MIKYSIIIPVYNAKETLGICLNAIKRQIDGQTEIIVVDDCSTQNEIKDIVKNFTQNFFRLKNNCGAGKVRNFGAKRAIGEWLIFIDSDVIISNNFFKEIDKKLKYLPKDASLQGVYSWQTPVNNIYSQFKNLYYYYNFFYRINQEKFSALSSHCFVIRRETFFGIGGFNHNIKTVIEDADFGFRLLQKGYKILLDRKLIVTHLKKFTLLSLLKNDYKLSFAKAKHVLRNIFREDKEKLIVISGGRLSETYVIILNVIITPIIFIFLILAILSNNITIFFIFLFFLLFFLLINFNFIKFISLKNNSIFIAKIIPILYLDMLSSFCGCLMGAADYYFLGNKY